MYNDYNVDWGSVCPKSFIIAEFVFALFFYNIIELVLVPPDLVPKGVLNDRKKVILDACLIRMNVVNFPTHYHQNASIFEFIFYFNFR